MKMDLTIRAMLPGDWPAVRAIYMEGIASGISTFEVDAPNWENWDHGHRQNCRLVALSPENQILGWAALSQISKRSAYHGVAEVSIYISERARGKGVGKVLLSRLVDESEQDGIWTLQAGIIAENEASIRLHTACGFRMIGRRERISKLNGIWHDTVLMERRSSIVGIV
jgi:phosphinothricin acetyltransferase